MFWRRSASNRFVVGQNGVFLGSAISNAPTSTISREMPPSRDSRRTVRSNVVWREGGGQDRSQTSGGRAEGGSSPSSLAFPSQRFPSEASGDVTSRPKST